ncbi:hypothetical protein DH2020_029624 [Rehmannia glutinosa]|uniref:30S ribosomal protein n=1 Tax=Rehmannia glutinosa TaxID=99300 RepID=A0ABR0VN34_REHGL
MSRQVEVKDARNLINFVDSERVVSIYVESIDHELNKDCHDLNHQDYEEAYQGHEPGMIEIDDDTDENEENDDKENDGSDSTFSDGFEESDFEYDDVLFDENIDQEIEWVGMRDESSHVLDRGKKVVENSSADHFEPSSLVATRIYKMDSNTFVTQQSDGNSTVTRISASSSSLTLEESTLDDENQGKKKRGVVVKPMERPRLVLKFIWMEKNIGIAIDQVIPGGHGTIPLSPYYFWPRKDAWEELRVMLESKPWISNKQMVILLNQATDVINLWQQSGGGDLA